MNRIFSLLIFFAIVFLITWVIYQWNDKIRGPRRKGRILQIKPLIELKKYGFNLENNEFYQGLVENYLTSVGYHWTGTVGKPIIWIQVFYNQTSLDENEIKKQIDYLEKKYGNRFWTLKFIQENISFDFGTIISQMEYNFFPPRIITVRNRIMKMIQILKDENFKPINNHDFELLIKNKTNANMV